MITIRYAFVPKFNKQINFKYYKQDITLLVRALPAILKEKNKTVYIFILSCECSLVAHNPYINSVTWLTNPIHARRYTKISLNIFHTYFYDVQHMFLLIILLFFHDNRDDTLLFALLWVLRGTHTRGAATLNICTPYSSMERWDQQKSIQS